MASLTRSPDGSYRLLFSIEANDRRGIRIGRMTEKKAIDIKEHVEEIVRSIQNGQAIDPTTTHWLSRIGGKLRKKLETAKLIAPTGPVKEKAPLVLGEFLNAYIRDCGELKTNTREVYIQCRDRLIAFFGKGKPLTEITAADAKRWLSYLKTKGKATKDGATGYKQATIAKSVQMARQFFAFAVDDKIIAENPFVKVKGGTMVNKSRQFFVTLDMAKRVYDACPNLQWRLIFCACRFAGLRCPSEVLAIKWCHVDWEREEITVPVSKLAHHAGKEVRVIPMFEPLKPLLEEAYKEACDTAYELAPDLPFEKDTYIILPTIKRRDVNLSTHMKRIIRKAGLTPWPRTFNNLRSSLESELMEDNPISVVVALIGNSVKVALDHYAQVRDTDRARAKMKNSGFDISTPNVSVAKMAHFPPSESSTNSGTENELKEKPKEMSVNPHGNASDTQSAARMSVKKYTQKDSNPTGATAQIYEETSGIQSETEADTKSVAFLESNMREFLESLTPDQRAHYEALHRKEG